MKRFLSRRTVLDTPVIPPPRLIARAPLPGVAQLPPLGAAPDPLQPGTLPLPPNAPPAQPLGPQDVAQQRLLPPPPYGHNFGNIPRNGGGFEINMGIPGMRWGFGINFGEGNAAAGAAAGAVGANENVPAPPVAAQAQGVRAPPQAQPTATPESEHVARVQAIMRRMNAGGEGLRPLFPPPTSTSPVASGSGPIAADSIPIEPSAIASKEENVVKEEIEIENLTPREVAARAALRRSARLAGNTTNAPTSNPLPRTSASQTVPPATPTSIRQPDPSPPLPSGTSSSTLPRLFPTLTPLFPFATSSVPPPDPRVSLQNRRPVRNVEEMLVEVEGTLEGVRRMLRGLRDQDEVRTREDGGLAVRSVEGKGKGREKENDVEEGIREQMEAWEVPLPEDAEEGL